MVDIHFQLKEDGRTAVLLKPYAVYALGRVINVPAGFETDFASVPRVLWTIVPPWGEYFKATIVHDYLYVIGTVPRAEADAIFLELMERAGVSRLRRTVMYLGVRAGGWVGWNQRAKNRNSKHV